MNDLRPRLAFLFFSLATCLLRPVVSMAQLITTIAGTGSAGFTGDGGPALNAQINTPLGICLDAAGNLNKKAPVWDAFLKNCE